MVLNGDDSQKRMYNTYVIHASERKQMCWLFDDPLKIIALEMRNCNDWCF